MYDIFIKEVKNDIRIHPRKHGQTDSREPAV